MFDRFIGWFRSIARARRRKASPLAVAPSLDQLVKLRGEIGAIQRRLDRMIASAQLEPQRGKALSPPQ